MVGRSFLAVAVSALALLVAATDAADGVAVDIASHKHLADSTGLINKNAVMHGNNVAITKSNILSRQDDDIVLEADGVPAEVTETGEKEALRVPDEDQHEQSEFYGGYGGYGGYGYRYRFSYPYYGGYRYGWRYPISYWNLYGSRYYGGCGFGHPYGGWYYC